MSGYHWDLIDQVSLALLPPLARNVPITDPMQGSAAECSIAIDSKTAKNVICAARQVPTPGQFAKSTVAIYYSTDVGETWTASSPLQLTNPEKNLVFGANANPSVAWDGLGNAYLLTLAVTPGLDDLIGIAFYKSVNGGVDWSPPVIIDADPADDKPNILIDTRHGQPVVYAFWMQIGQSEHTLGMARSDDLGVTWATKNKIIKGFEETFDSWPSFAIAPEGLLYVAYGTDTGFGVKQSGTAGITFTNCTDVNNLNLLSTSGATVYVGNVLESADTIGDTLFRANSFISICAGKNGLLLCAWLEPYYLPKPYPGAEPVLESVGISYRRSLDCGQTWEVLKVKVGPLGKVLNVFPVPKAFSNSCLFSPQLSIGPSGTIVCNYYVYSPISEPTGAIGVYASFSFDNGQSFSLPHKISQPAWSTDPTQTNMIVLGTLDQGSKSQETITFIGDYFGLATGAIGDQGEDGFVSAWTDGRTGSEQIYSSTVKKIPQ